MLENRTININIKSNLILRRTDKKTGLFLAFKKRRLFGSLSLKYQVYLHKSTKLIIVIMFMFKFDFSTVVMNRLILVRFSKW